MMRLGRWSRKHVVRKIDWANMDHGYIEKTRKKVKQKEKKKKKKDNYDNTLETELELYHMQSHDVFFR